MPKPNIFYAPGKEPLYFGEREILGFVVEAHTEEHTAEDQVYRDNKNIPFCHVVSGSMREYTFDVIPLKTVESINAEPGNVLEFGSVKFVVTSFSKKGENKGLEKWSIKGKTLDGVDYDLEFIQED